MAAPLPTPSGVIRFRLMHTFVGAPTPLGTKFDQAYTGGAPSVGDLTTLAGKIRAAYATDLAGLLHSDWSLTEVEAIDLANPTNPTGSDTTAVVGTRAGNPFDIGVAACLFFDVDRRYRGSKPKMFAPWGVTADGANAWSWSSAFITIVETQWGLFQVAIDGQGAGATTLGGQVGISYIGPPYHVVTSPTTGRGRNVGTPRNPPLVLGVTSEKLSPTYGSQRKRLRAV